MTFLPQSRTTFGRIKTTAASLAALGVLMTGSTALAQVDYSDYEVEIYDSQTQTAINTPPQPQMQTQTQSQPQVQAQPTIARPVTQPIATVPSSATPSPAPTSALRDISSEFIDVIAGVPIMKDPQSCGKGLLEIGVTVENVKNSKGIIVADLHDDVKENFLVWDKVVLRVRATATEGETKFCMPLTKPGDYSIAVYHDKNSNKEFDKNFLGIPSERFGMSNNPKFGLSSPEYEQATFTVPASGSNIRIRLVKSSEILGGQKKKKKKK